jgi:branched-chain amino acid transport system permease protein
MSDATQARDVRVLRVRPAAARTIRYWPWLAALLISIVLPWLFYDWQHARHSGFAVSVMSQTGMMIIFALSFNMLMGQAGLLSFCHSVLFGLAGYSTVHFLNADGAGDMPVPMELIPLLSGLTGLGFAAVFGYVATKQRSTAFAMITLGIVQLVTTAATMFNHFFGGEGGVRTDRVIGHSLFGLRYAQSIEVYYLIVAWMLIAAIGMYFHTVTPLGRMANACRDNHERAQFVGYDPRMVRFVQFTLAGFYAGIAGGLFAIDYEIVTFDAVAAPLAANALLMAYIGGATTFFGPVLGAILITLMQSGVSLMSNSWLIYVGVLFIAMVTFAPAGLTGIILEHAPIARSGLMCRLVLPYARILVPGLIVLSGFIGLVELASFFTIGMAQGKHLALFGQAIDIHSPVPWLISLVCLLGGGVWLSREARRFKSVWDGLAELAKRDGSQRGAQRGALPGEAR